MKPKRLTWLLVAACVALLAGLLASWLVPYWRERGAITEFERMGVPVFDHSDLIYTPVGIHIETGGPEWLREIVGDDWMRPFGRVRGVWLFFNSPENPLGSPPSAAPPLFDLLVRLRNIDQLVILEGQLSESELAKLRARCPEMDVEVYPRPPPAAAPTEDDPP
ncbi:MAG: hypothetical protein WD066_13780 [Planctomycetaceae bacterium]